MMIVTDEWGWFIREDIPYVDSLSAKVKHKIKKGNFNKNNVIIKQAMPVIIEEKPFIKKLDDKYDFGNMFASGLVNTILVCSAGVWLYFTRDKF